MRPVLSRDELTQAVGDVPRSGSGYLTSFFSSSAKIESWITAGVLSILKVKNALLILRSDANIVRINHIAADLQALQIALAALADRLPTSVLVADLVGRAGSLYDVTDAYRRNGFVVHKCLTRMQRTGPYSLQAADTAGVEPAASDDVSNLHAFMKRWLDPLSEKIQQPAELAVAVAANQVLVIRHGSELAGILIYEASGVSTILRYWHVAGHHRDKGIGARLMRAFLHRRGSSQRITLWVMSDNSGAITKYRHYGFEDEGLTDVIMVRQLEPAIR